LGRVPYVPVLLVLLVGGDYADEIAKFRAFARERIEMDGTPGLTIGFRKGDFTWVEGFGYSDLENRVPAKAESAYRLASVTKPMTAAAVLKLVEEGKVDLDAEARAYVPFFPAKPHPVTVRQLLGHLGGVSHYRNYDLEGHFKTRKDTRESIAVFADFDLVAEPGTRFAYSSYGYNLLGAVIEGASGKPFGEFMREKIWGPLGMESTRMDDPDAIIPNRVRGYRRGPDGRLMNSEFVDISSRFAAGGTRSTVPDLLAFADVFRPGRVLSARSIDLMVSSMTIREGRFTDYGMGWGIGTVNGQLVVSHSGGQAETATFLLCVPDDDFAIAAATNLESGDRDPYVVRLYQLVMNEPPPGRSYHYLPDPAQRVLFEAANVAFETGLRRLRRAGGAPAITDEEAAAAFAYFDAVVEAALEEKDIEKASAKVHDGRHPLAGEALTRMGACMAAKLVAEGTPVESLRVGPILFFRRYGALPASTRFREPFERILDRWATDWGKTGDAGRFALELSPSTDWEEFAGRFSKHFPDGFADASIAPDLLPDLVDLGQAYFLSGNPAKAARAMDFAISLYPARAEPRFYSGVARLALGETEAGVAELRHSLDFDPRGPASAPALGRFARNLKSAGQAQAAIALLRAGTDLHPAVASLHDGLGDLLAEMGDREAALAAYRRALEIEPDLATAKEALAKLSAQ
jgi:CubicO group peptidase (beta-lactamase class C family)